MTMFSVGFKNAVKIVLVCALYLIFISTAGYILAKPWVWWALILACLAVLFALLLGEWWILLWVKAKKSSDQKLTEVAAEIASQIGLPLPKIFVTPDAKPKLFSVGRSVCVSQSALQVLNKQELQGLIARQLIHIRDLDTKLHDIITVLVGPLSFLVLAITTSPADETSVDFEAAKITGDPDSMANALEKLSDSQDVKYRVKLLRQA